MLFFLYVYFRSFNANSVWPCVLVNICIGMSFCLTASERAHSWLRMCMPEISVMKQNTRGFAFIRFQSKSCHEHWLLLVIVCILVFKCGARMWSALHFQNTSLIQVCCNRASFAARLRLWKVRFSVETSTSKVVWTESSADVNSLCLWYWSVLILLCVASRLFYFLQLVTTVDDRDLWM